VSSRGRWSRVSREIEERAHRPRDRTERVAADLGDLDLAEALTNRGGEGGQVLREQHACACLGCDLVCPRAGQRDLVFAVSNPIFLDQPRFIADRP